MDQELESSIRKTRRSNRNHDRQKRQAPAGGVKKHQSDNKRTGNRAGKAKIPPPKVEVLVEPLPRDVTGPQLKEYIQEALAFSIGKVEILVNPDKPNQSTARVNFHTVEDAQEAVKKLDQIKIDNKPITLRMLGNPGAGETAAEKPLSDRITKVQPKSAALVKNAGQDKRKERKKKQKKGKDARPAKKTVEELDMEMADYFANNDGVEPTTGSATAPAAESGAGAPTDATMEDEIS